MNINMAFEIYHSLDSLSSWVSYQIQLINKALEFCAFDLWSRPIPKNKISVFVFADNFTQLIFSDAEVL